MSEETHAASSPAVETDVFNGQSPTVDEYNSYRQSGELPARFKPEPAVSAPADSPEKTVAPEGDEPEIAPESDPEEAQEPPHKVSAAEKRIKQLLAKVKELERNQQPAKQDVKPDSSPAQASPESARNKPAIDAKDDKGNPKYSTYEDYVEDLADWKAEQQLARYKREQADNAARQAVKAKLDEARSRYEDADAVIFPAARTIAEAQMPQVVKEVFAQSDLFTDLCYVVGSDPDELAKFVSLAQTNPRAAIAKVFEYERGIQEGLAKGAGQTARDASGKFVAKSAEPPEPKKTQAPKPPSPVGGGSSRAFDVSDESLSPDAWFQKRNEQVARKRS